MADASMSMVKAIFQPDSPEWLMNGTRFHAWRFGAWLYQKPDGTCEWHDHLSDGTNPHKAENIGAARAAVMAAYRENEARELAFIDGPTRPADEKVEEETER